MMLVEYVFKNGLFITCTVEELMERLACHRQNYTTLKELIDNLSPAGK